jgi:hypothetical protein
MAHPDLTRKPRARGIDWTWDGMIQVNHEKHQMHEKKGAAGDGPIDRSNDATPSQL